MNYSLFVLHFIYGISDRTIALLILYDNSLQNFASPQSIWIFHSSLFVFHLHMHSIYNKTNILWIHNNDRIHKIFVLNL